MEWERLEKTTIMVKMLAIPEFRESPGPTCNLAGAELVAFFNYLWTDELNTSILTETNR